MKFAAQESFYINHVHMHTLPEQKKCEALFSINVGQQLLLVWLPSCASISYSIAQHSFAARACCLPQKQSGWRTVLFPLMGIEIIYFHSEK